MNFLSQLVEIRDFSKRVKRQEGESMLKYWKRVQDAYANLSEQTNPAVEPDSDPINYDEIISRVTRNVRAVRGTDIGPTIDRSKSQF